MSMSFASATYQYRRSLTALGSNSEVRGQAQMVRQSDSLGSPYGAVWTGRCSWPQAV